jgi:hypothetical protein
VPRVNVTTHVSESAEHLRELTEQPQLAIGTGVMMKVGEAGIGAKTLVPSNSRMANANCGVQIAMSFTELFQLLTTSAFY